MATMLLHDSPLDLLVQHCAEETARFFRRVTHDTRYCFEIFRRAIVARQDDAWAALYTQYHSMVIAWLSRHPQLSLTGEEPENLVNAVFEKIWTALTAEKFADFTDLAALLRYLQMCSHSVVMDSARRVRRHAHEIEPSERALESEAELHSPQQPSPEHEVLDRLSAAELWQRVRAQLHDDLEELVIYATFVLDESPREIYSHHADRFDSIQEVYNVKRNAMRRIERHFQTAK